MQNIIFRFQHVFQVGILFLICLTMLTIACSSDTPPNSPENKEPTPASVTTVQISPLFTTIFTFREAQVLTARAIDADGQEITGAVFEWSSSDASVVSVVARSQFQGTANATAIANGNATITAKSSGINGTASVTIEQKVAIVSLSSTASVEFPGDTVRVRAVAMDALRHVMPNAPLTWTSTKLSVATADTTGLITGTGFGTATITATAGEVSESLLFEVIGDRFFKSGDVRLRYDLDLPNDSGGPFPAIVFVHGSGRLDRNMIAHGTNPFVSQGVAVLRYDKRGVGESTGGFFNIGPRNSASGLGVLARDVVAAVRFLGNFPEINPEQIGVMGNSQGGWIGPLAAAETDKISFMLMWSGPTVSVGLEIFYSSLADGTSTLLDSVYAQLSDFTGLHGYDPLPTLESLDIPSLWLYGAMDRSIPTRVDTLSMRRLQGMGKSYDFIMYPFARHDLRDTRTGQFVSLWSDYLAWMREKGIL